MDGNDFRSASSDACSADLRNDLSSVHTPERGTLQTGARAATSLSHERQASPKPVSSYRRETPLKAASPLRREPCAKCHQLQQLKETASMLFDTLERDSSRSMASDRHRLQETMEQLQPKADAIRKLVEEAEEMREHARDCRRKRQQNLHLIERLKEEDKAIDNELQELPAKLQSLDVFREEERASLEAARAEYRLVQKQNEYALLAWEEKIRVYEKALGIRIHQDDAGGPTIIRFSGLFPGASKRSVAPGEESVQEENADKGECFFAFQLDAHGAVSDAHCWPPVDIFEDVMEAFGRAEISLPIVVACMRRSFKEWRKPCVAPTAQSRLPMRREPALSGVVDKQKDNPAFSDDRPVTKAVSSSQRGATPPERTWQTGSYVAGNDRQVTAFTGARVQKQPEARKMKDAADRTSLFVFGSGNKEFETVQRRWQN
ncbi:hypothetical protein TGDOM2_232430 [Toxoplasma gondii GAB2-2007-GAL-DOM2]|uniref:Kinetochore protein SPC25 n=8 Tax=Toxoplasma gondii TaxID=5811 RepID=S7WBX5_TOXGG|nr:hypothetical protein TGGT1_232430 [Toxoplasma gondii GT1]KAF4641842.1 hypothetical protein TGRH88_076540 [Toxoplasma gondii]KFG48713.1 hypothetical protein TGDOM2_232430 [Toxoplasma gondii GAB2-2007-GAL-DOM2]KFG51189.1 hypothetical protein TGP89_232430 [Toxoplasma gondii p89]KFG55295.1 hypothetical protein TGFOU_232430 [Toxoplasma gondii FOU]PIM03155.1 hypothetical protein TGCOUG_232430 [Toxoplasma gondii COUG]PUA92636.1 hypothetical protein TGBR9_232430 [Toxoplasma gondii TgCATBr9]RQX757